MVDASLQAAAAAGPSILSSFHPSISILLFPPLLQQRNRKSESAADRFAARAGHPIRGRSMLYPLLVVTGILADQLDDDTREIGIHCVLFTGIFREQDKPFSATASGRGRAHNL